MSKPSYDQEAVARVYARALYPLAEEAGVIESLLGELESFAAFQLSDPDFDHFLSSPLVAAKVRREVLESSLRGRVSDLLLDTLQVLNQRDRGGLLPALATSFRHEFHLQAGRVEVEVQTASPISEEALARLTAAIVAVTKRTPEVSHVVDEALIGGIVVRVEDHKFDLSLANDLRVLEQRLLNRASEEIHSGKYLAE